MKIVISGREYRAISSDEATLADLLALKSATGLSQRDLRALGEIAEGDDDNAILLTGILVWFARRRAGERLTLEEACDVPLAEIEFVEEPGDEKPASPDPHQAAGLEVSGPAATPRPRPADRQPKKKASKRASTPA